MLDFLSLGDENKILKSLPLHEYGKLLPHLELIKLKQGDIIQPSGFPVKYIYFPQTCLIALVTIFKDGSCIEAGLISAEGLVGASCAVNRSSSARQAQVLTSGTCLRIEANILRRLCSESSLLSNFIQNYLCAYYEQVTQLGACNSCHELQVRFARMLLLSSLNNRIPLTQEAAGMLLGAHRPSVTKISIYFKSKGLISYQRGKMLIIDRQRLAAEACECHQLIKDIYSTYFVQLNCFAQLNEQNSKLLQLQSSHFGTEQPEYRSSILLTEQS